MTALRLVPADTVPPTPWRNGGGTTRELLRVPDTDDWRLRLSLADIAADGPFSAFDGVTRWFAVVDGAGVRLAWPTSSRTLTAADAPVRFDGGDAPTCTLIDGATRDLNLMLRGASPDAALIAVWAGAPFVARGGVRGVFARRAVVLAREGHADIALAAHTLAWTDAPDLTAWTLREDAASSTLRDPAGFWITAP